MMNRILVVGGANGIGLAIATEMAKKKGSSDISSDTAIVKCI